MSACRQLYVEPWDGIPRHCVRARSLYPATPPGYTWALLRYRRHRGLRWWWWFLVRNPLRIAFGFDRDGRARWEHARLVWLRSEP